MTPEKIIIPNEMPKMRVEDLLPEIRTGFAQN